MLNITDKSMRADCSLGTGGGVLPAELKKVIQLDFKVYINGKKRLAYCTLLCVSCVIYTFR